MGITFSRDSQWIATASRDGTLKIWPIEPVSPGLRLEGHDQVICAVSFSPDGRLVASGSFDQTARIWDSGTGRTLQTIPVGCPLLSLAFSPDGKDLVTPGPDNSACIWRLQTGSGVQTPESAPESLEPQKRLLGHERAVLAVAYNGDGQWVATGSKDGTARIWETSTGKERLRLAGHTGQVTAVAFAPKNTRLLATGGADSTIRLWDTASGDCLRVIKAHAGAVLCLAFSPDGELLASGSADSTARIWETRSGRPLVPPLTGHPQGVIRVAFSPEGQRLVTAAGGINFHHVVSRDFQVRLWDVQSGHQLLALFPHSNSVYAVAFSPDGRRLATGSFDNTVTIQTAFPWHASDYPGDSRVSLANRIEDYKRQLWRATASPSESGRPGQQNTVSVRRMVRSWLGEITVPPAGAKTRAFQPIPTRPEHASSNQVDLTACYNVALNEPWQAVDSLDEVDQSLAALRPECQSFAGVLFDARGLVQLRRAAADCELFPERVAIPMKRAFGRLHCLHGTRWDAEQGMAVAAFVLHYKDGSAVELPVSYGVHLREVTSPSARQPDCAQGQVAWQGSARSPRDWQPRLYKTTFANPKPTVEVVEIEYVSKLTRSGPFLVGLTLE